MADLNILANLNKYVKDEMEKENIPSDATYAIVAGFDNNGAKIMASVLIHKSNRINTKVGAVWHHDWDGDDTAGVKLILTGK